MNYIVKYQIHFCLLLLLAAGVPCFAQDTVAPVDFSGEWFSLAHEDQEVDRRGGPPPGDYTGFPINDASRMRADTYDASIVALPAMQCRPHPTGHQQLGPDATRIDKIMDTNSREIVAFRMICQRCTKERIIWLDGRAHPPEEALHTWEGFSTGTWQGDMLVVTVTHLKESYLRRNGLEQSSHTTITEFLTLHGDYLNWTMVIDDPDYLTEPLIRNASLIRAPKRSVPPYPCTPNVEEDRPKGSVPHYLPGQNPYLTEFASQRAIPFEASRGGAETMYPEYQSKIKGMAMAPPAAYKPTYKDGTVRPLPRSQTPANPNLHILPVHGNVYLLAGTGGGNILFSVGNDGIMLVDSGPAQATDKVLAAIEQFGRERDPNGPPTPIRFIVNTSDDPDHIGGNEKIVQSNLFRPVRDGLQIVAQEKTRDRMSAAPVRAQPTDTYVRDRLKVQPRFNGEGIEIIYAPGHTDGDSVVWFRSSDVIGTGDTFGWDYPMIDVARGGSIQTLIDSVNSLMDLAYPDDLFEGGTILVPGHGGFGDSADLAYYQQMLTIIRDRIQDMVKKGMTLQQVKAAKPTMDYDPIYGRKTGSAEKFVEALYQSLSKREQK